MDSLKLPYYDLPTTINITLYKNNYFDNRIISQLRRNTECITIPNDDNSLVVKVKEFKSILKNKFSRETSQIQNVSDFELSRSVTSIFFINQIFDNFSNLKYVKINVSKRRQYTRLIPAGPTQRLLAFEYKIINSVIDFTKYLDNKGLRRLNKFLRDIKLVEDDPFFSGSSYFNVTSQNLLHLVALQEDHNIEETNDFTQKYDDLIVLLYQLIHEKVQEDDSAIVLITDYPK